MKIEPLSINGLLLIEPTRIRDDRGFFSETFRADRLAALAGPVEFVQDNHSFSAFRGTIRGLHFQKPPQAQGKLIQVMRGSILDVAVDIRSGSGSYGQHVAVELSAQNGRQLWIPPGFLHGFCTLVDDVDVLYKVTATYSREHDAAVRWNDPAIGIPWPAASAEAVLSEKDSRAPFLRDIVSGF